jgi:hypothetical protein
MLDKILSCKIVYAQEILRCETTLIRKLVEIPKGNVKPHALISLPRVSSCNVTYLGYEKTLASFILISLNITTECGGETQERTLLFSPFSLSSNPLYMSEFVRRFMIKDTDFEGIKDILEYLDPHESVSFKYIVDWYICEFSENVNITCVVFIDDFPNAKILDRK